MAKAVTLKIKLVSSADTGYYYVTKKNSRTMTDKLVKTKYDPQALCAQALTSFEQVISLDVSSLLPADYIVIVNGVETSFQLPGPGQPANAQ